MTTQEDIVFFCIFCSQKIAIHDEPKGGITVECPVCHRRIPVPGRDPSGRLTLHPSPTLNGAKRITIPKGTPLNGSASHSPSSTVTIPPPPPENIPPNNDLSLFVLGCVCLVLGVLLVLVTPNAVFIHTSLLLTALLAAVLCIGRRLVATGAVLLFTTVIAVQLLEVPRVKPLLLQLVPKPEIVQQREPPPSPVVETRRLVIDENGRAILLPAGFEEYAMKTPPMTHEEREPLEPAPQPAEEPAPEESATPEPAEIVTPIVEPEPAVAEEKAPEEKIEELPEVIAPARPAPVARARPPTPTPSSLTSKPTLPLSLYNDCSDDPPYTPSGWMGYFDAIELDECWDDNPHSGKTCFRMAYNATYYWGGVAWQMPPNNWGSEAGGYDLSSAKELTFWARAERDATMAEFKVGIRSPAPFADTATVTTGKKQLSRKWKQFTLPLKDLDLSRVISGFVCVVEGSEIPPIIYLDDIEYR